MNAIEALTSNKWFANFKKATTRYRRQLGIVLLLFVIAAAIYFIATFPDEANGLHVGWTIVGILYATFVVQTFNATEFRLQAYATGNSISFFEAQNVAVNGAIANLLPLPGGALVRGAWLARRSSKKTAGIVLIATALFWVGVSTLIAGLAIVSFNVVVGIAFIAVGSILLSVGYLALRRINAKAAWQIAVFEVAMTVTGIGLLWIAFLAIGYEIGFDRVAATAAGAPIAGSIGLAPGGIGLSESLTALLARVVEVAASIGFLAASMRRLMNIVGIAILKAFHELLLKRNQSI